MIDSFTFLFWDKDERNYSYTAEVFDGKDWTIVADKSTEKCRSWQVIRFSLRAVNMVRIRANAVYDTNCNELRIVKFRFPAS